MKLMKIAKLFTGLVVAGCLYTPVLAHAGDLTVVNNTNEASTTVTNGGLCSSTVLGASGVTQAHSTNVVSNFKLRIACGAHPNDCQSDVYMTSNCTGPVVAKVLFSVNTGILKIDEVLGSNYNMTGTGFNAQINYK